MTGKTQAASRPAGPCCFVIFGASGDLTKRLLIPALYNLARDGLLPDPFCIIGFSTTGMSADAFRREIADSLGEFAGQPLDPALVERLSRDVAYVSGNADDPAAYDRLRSEIERFEAVRPTGGNRLFYLATPPTIFEPIARRLAAAGLTREDGFWRRLVVEKPFGTDLESAQRLNRALLEVLDEHQIYRIDHYLGKETVQNIMILRFANGLFEPIWNRNHIDHVQITVAETVSVERRGRFYDATGALRDMVPNHLCQLLSLIAMEPPARFDADIVRSRTAEALDAIQIPGEAEILRSSVRAQYGAGLVNGAALPAYRDAPAVDPRSTTETYVALKLAIDNWRWAGVPFYLRTGKAMCRRRTEIAIKFKQAPLTMFRTTHVDDLAQNFLILGMQPSECISLQFNAKIPGPDISLKGVGMTFEYKDYFDAVPSTGYETLIYDCMSGDATLFRRADGVEIGWRAVQPFLDAWAAAGGRGLATYPAGSEGPPEAAELLARDGRRWRTIA